jgi:hypothetical protein
LALKIDKFNFLINKVFIEYFQIKPNPLQFSIAVSSFILSFSLDEYSGKTKWNVQVIADGSASESGPPLC